MRVDDLIKGTVSKLRDVGIESARLDALLLLEYATARDRSWLLAHPEHNITGSMLAQFQQMSKRRVNREPLSYITGFKEFYGFDFKVNQDVLIPRPETELVVEHAITKAPPAAEILELGTGTGCIAVSLKLKRPDLAITATDISEAALKVARQNAKQHSADIKFVLSDLFESIAGQFDLILANLPYVPTDTRHQPELDFEPDLALFAGSDGLDYYRRFMAELGMHLNPTGLAIIEAGPTQRSQLNIMARKGGLKLTSISEYVSILEP